MCSRGESTSEREVVFHLNQSLVSENDDDKIPIVHKFDMSSAQSNKIADQSIYILKQGEDNNKGKTILLILFFFKLLSFTSHTFT